MCLSHLALASCLPCLFHPLPGTSQSIKHKPVNLESTPPTTSLMRLLYSGPVYTCHHHPSVRYQTTMGIPYALEPMKLFKLTSPKPACLAWHFASCRNYTEGPSLPCLITARGNTLCFSVLSPVAWHILSLDLWIYVNHLFNGDCLPNCCS